MKKVSRRTGNARLLKLAKLLEDDAKRKKGICFDLGTWGRIKDTEKPLSCGTTACAMGLAALSGAFKRQGLKWKTRGTNCIIDIGYGNTWNPMIAAAHLFGIELYQVNYLFIRTWGMSMCVGAEGERAVAARIRKFVAERATS
jgi:hypothetical protein